MQTAGDAGYTDIYLTIYTVDGEVQHVVGKSYVITDTFLTVATGVGSSLSINTQFIASIVAKGNPDE